MTGEDSTCRIGAWTGAQLKPGALGRDELGADSTRNRGALGESRLRGVAKQHGGACEQRDERTMD